MKFINKNIFFIILLCISLLGNVFLVFLLANNAYEMRQNNQNQQVNLKILSFTNLFIEKVLMSNQEVDFNTRLTLETMVRNLNDKDILNQWEKFTQASDNQNASTEAKKLLDLLVKKISY